MVLRHKPEVIGLKLDSQGWVETKALLEGMASAGRGISLEDLEVIVRDNNKQRFAFNEDKTKIRANQGHSVEIDLDYEPVEPPETLYHGTATKNLDSIRGQGLLKGSRHDVHLSEDVDTATDVGNRHGKVVVLIVRSGEMHKAGYPFFCSTNGVWLTSEVPVEYIDFP